jgi:hypothetical protein
VTTDRNSNITNEASQQTDLDIPPRCIAGAISATVRCLGQRERAAYNSTRAGLPCPMTLSKLLGSRSRTLDARAPARNDRERIDSENFMKCMKYVQRGGAAGRERSLGDDAHVEF